MTWNGPKTWTAGEKGRSTDLNTYVSQNLAYLFNGRAKTVIDVAQSDFTTTSTVFADVSATYFSATLTIRSGRARVKFAGNLNIWASSNATLYLTIALDGSNVGGSNGLVIQLGSNGGVETADAIKFVGLDLVLEDLSDGSHTFRLQWKVSGTGTPTAKLYSNGKNVKPQFSVEEV